MLPAVRKSRAHRQGRAYLQTVYQRLELVYSQAGLVLLVIFQTSHYLLVASFNRTLTRRCAWGLCRNPYFFFNLLDFFLFNLCAVSAGSVTIDIAPVVRVVAM